MDSLTKMSVEARKRGISYGKYAALVHEGLLPPPGEVVDEPNGRTKSYRNCGKSFVPYHGGVKYCSDQCRNAAASARVLARWHKKHDPKPNTWDGSSV